MTAPNRNALWAEQLVGALAASGVARACVSPGSRSTPLALACLQHPGLQTTVHHDERGAAFFALGLAKLSRAPALLVCTSGTAAANYLPAVVEASLSGVPLIVVTADRPHEVRGWGAPQTIDQVALYGSYARWSVDLPLPEPRRESLAFLRHTAARAVQVATSAPRGPVHLNVPLRDPLPPLAVPGDVPADLEVDVPPQLAPSVARCPEEALRAAAATIAASPRGVVAVGPLDATPELERALARFADATGYPILAEVTSSLRTTELRPALAMHGELLARSPRFARGHAPELMIRLGHAPTTRALARFHDSAAHTLRIDDAGTWIDPAHRAEALLSGDPAATLGRLAELVRELAMAHEPRWRADFQLADDAAARALVDALGAEEQLGELHAARALFDALPAEVPLFVASSMPIRDLESAASVRASPGRVLANRGANGIDGTVASALGAAAAAQGRAALLIGDVALLHDLNSLAMARLLGLELTVVLVNNDGGGIFSFLEVASSVEASTFERLWGTPHATDFASAVAAFGGTCTRVDSPAELERTLHGSFAKPAPGVRLIEVRTERAQNVRAHQRVFAAVEAALESEPWRSP